MYCWVWLVEYHILWVFISFAVIFLPRWHRHRHRHRCGRCRRKHPQSIGSAEKRNLWCGIGIMTSANYCRLISIGPRSNMHAHKLECESAGRCFYYTPKFFIQSTQSSVLRSVRTLWKTCFSTSIAAILNCNWAHSENWTEKREIFTQLWLI